MKVEDSSKQVSKVRADLDFSQMPSLSLPAVPTALFLHNMAIPAPRPEIAVPEPKIDVSPARKKKPEASSLRNGSNAGNFTASFSPQPKVWICEKCDKTFKSKEGWKIHCERHEGRSRYFCKFCNRGFMAQTHLKAHESEHTNEPPCPCDVCGQRFKYPFSLKKHRTEVHGFG